MYNRVFKLLLILWTGVLCPIDAAKLQWDRRGMHQYCADVAMREGWVLSGEGYFHDEPLVSPSLSFSASKNLLLEDARRLVVHECQRLLLFAARTQSKKVTDTVGPLGIRNIVLGVHFKEPATNLRCELPYVEGVFVSRGEILYDSYDNTTRRFARMYAEPYEEAVRIVQAEQAAECR